MNKALRDRFLYSDSGNNRKSKIENLKWLGVLAILVLLLGCVGMAEAQQAGKVNRIGFLRVGPPPTTWIEGFRQGLRELGYLEGQNITIEYGSARSVAQVPDVAAELVRLKVDVLVASGTPSVLPARNATSTIPVVFVAAIDPVATGVAASLARPGGNVTGVTAMHADLTGKRLELLKELLPKLSRIAVLVRDHPGHAQYVQEAELAARALGMKLQILTVRDPSDFEGAFSAARGASALLQVDDAMFTAHRTQIAELALKNRLPTMYGYGEAAVEAGGLMTYGARYEDLYRRAATYVDKILKGRKPADLPVEQPMKFELMINLKTAKQIGLTISPNLLARADKVLR